MLSGQGMSPVPAKRCSYRTRTRALRCSRSRGSYRIRGTSTRTVPVLLVLVVLYRTAVRYSYCRLPPTAGPYSTGSVLFPTRTPSSGRIKQADRERERRLHQSIDAVHPGDGLSAGKTLIRALCSRRSWPQLPPPDPPRRAPAESHTVAALRSTQSPVKQEHPGPGLVTAAASRKVRGERMPFPCSACPVVPECVWR